jgi:Tol biopolymer transport system component
MYSPEWLPDGESIIVSALTDRNGGRNNLDLYLVDPYSGTMQAITDAARVDHVAPDISPDGARVAYVARYTNSYQSEIMVLDLEHSASRILRTNLGKGLLISIEWSPDGRRIAFIRADYVTTTQTLYTMSADGGEAQRVDLPCAVVGFSWRPDS